ncbi:MAG: nuclear transport factor 2 family protein [Egibacteraceae bacterium]
MPNTDLIFRMYDYFGTGNMDAIKSELFAPDIVWRMPGHHPLSGEMHGADEVIDFFNILFKGGITVDNAHFGELDDGTVVEGHMGHATADGREYLFPTCTTYGIRDGKIADVRVHTGDQHAVDQCFWALFRLKPIGTRLDGN